LLQTQRVKITIPTPNYSCEYRISAPSLKYRNSGLLKIWVESTYFSSVFIYSGTAHHNLTALIEGNSTASVGAPYSVNIDDGTVIVAYAVYAAATSTSAANLNGSFTFSFNV
jgi:hypothetical protein